MTENDLGMTVDDIIIRAAEIIKKRREEALHPKVRKTHVYTKPRWRVTLYDYPSSLLPEGVDRKVLHVKEYVRREEIIEDYPLFTVNTMKHWLSRKGETSKFFDNIVIEKI